MVSKMSQIEAMSFPMLHDVLHTALQLPIGYHFPRRYMRTKSRILPAGNMPMPLRAFVESTAAMAHEMHRVEHVGVAYLRVIDSKYPENYMKWHRDNEDGGVRFTTAVSSDGIGVNLAFPYRDTVEGQLVSIHDRHWQASNGEIAMFTTEVHGVLQLPPRDAKTAVFFTTMYNSWRDVDLHTTNNTATESHAILPTLER